MYRVAFCIFLIISPIYGNSNTLKECLYATFVKEYKRPRFFIFTTYCDYMCHQNVALLIKKLQKTVPNFKPAESKVLYINSRMEGKKMFVGYNARKPDPDPSFNNTPAGQQVWGFHVVLEHKGLIYDLDFKKEATPTLRVDYFKEMFEPNDSNVELIKNEKVSTTMSALKVLVLNGADYLKSYSTDKLVFHCQYFDCESGYKDKWIPLTDYLK